MMARHQYLTGGRDLKFEGAPVVAFWKDFIEPFIRKGIDEWLEHIAELCLQRAKDPKQYLPTVEANLNSAIRNVYYEMASIDFGLRKASVCCLASENFGKNIKRKDVSNETIRMIDYLNDRYKEVLNTAEADFARLSVSGKADLPNEKSADINIQNSNVILGDVNQPENLQIGNNARIQKYSMIKKIGIIGTIAALLTIFHLLGWLEPIKAIISKILLDR